VARKGQFGPGHPGWKPFKPGESGHERAAARVEIAVDILRQGRDAPEVRAVVERVSAAIADPIDRARKIAQELAPWCVENIAGAVAADSRRLIAFVGPVRVRVDAALQILKVAGISAALDMRDDVSERFRNVVAAWFEPGPPSSPPPSSPTPLPPDPGEPSRRRRDRNRPTQDDASGS
jgi:hypothetical protein